MKISGDLVSVWLGSRVSHSAAALVLLSNISIFHLSTLVQKTVLLESITEHTHKFPSARPINHGPWARFSLLPIFLNRVLLKWPYLLVHAWAMNALL